MPVQVPTSELSISALHHFFSTFIEQLEGSSLSHSLCLPWAWQKLEEHLCGRIVQKVFIMGYVFCNISCKAGYQETTNAHDNIGMEKQGIVP